jgi:hypothetical protein
MIVDILIACLVFKETFVLNFFIYINKNGFIRSFLRRQKRTNEKVDAQGCEICEVSEVCEICKIGKSKNASTATKGSDSAFGRKSPDRSLPQI